MKKIKIILLFTGILFSVYASAQQTKSFQWIGGPTYILQLGSFKILTDPMLCPKSDTAFVIKKHPTTGAINTFVKRLTEPAVFDTTNVDVLLISHLHADHFDKEAKEILNKNLTTVVPPANKETVFKWGFYNTIGLKWNDTITFKKDFETLKIIAVKALHAHDEHLNTELGHVNGYIIEYDDGKNIYRIYWTGDTVWFDKIKDYKKFGKINLLIPNMGAVGADGNIGRRGLDAKDCKKIIQCLNPTSIIPVHHSTFSHYVEPISVLQKLLEKTKYKSQLKVIKENSTIKIGNEMTNIYPNTSNITQQYFTNTYDPKNSSLIKLNPHSSFTTEREKQSDIYLIEGSITIDGETYESGTYISTGKVKELLTNTNAAKFFFYQEPIEKTSEEITLKPTQQVWGEGGVSGMKTAQLRSFGHSLILVSWETGTAVPFHIHLNGEEIFVLRGELFDRETSIKSDEWVRMLPNTGHSPNTKERTLILLRNGHL